MYQNFEHGQFLFLRHGVETKNIFNPNFFNSFINSFFYV